MKLSVAFQSAKQWPELSLLRRRSARKMHLANWRDRPEAVLDDGRLSGTLSPMKPSSSLVERWLPVEAWRQWVPRPAHPIIEALSAKGVNVCRIGTDGNYKAPLVYVFVQSEFEPEAVLASIQYRAGLKADADGCGIISLDYVWVGFEPGVCQAA